MNKQKRMVLLVLGFALLLLGSIFAFLYQNGDPIDDGILSISEIRVCQNDIFGQEIQSNYLCGNTFPNSLKFLYVCGNFEYSRKGFNPNVYVYKNDSKYPIYYDSLPLKDSDRYCKKIVLPSEGRKGRYTVKIYYLRNLLTSLDFTIH